MADADVPEMTDPEAQAKLASVYRDCADLAHYILTARREIAQMRPKDLTEKRLPRAGQELDAIVQATEQATNTIMEAAEQIMAANVGSRVVQDAVMQIFEACSFQDITGQRISKVVKTIEHVEERLEALKRAWGPDLGTDEPAPSEPQDEEAALLNGPALDGEGASQDDVDALFD